MPHDAQSPTHTEPSSPALHIGDGNALDAFGLGLLIVDRGQNIVHRNKIADSLLPVADTLDKAFAHAKFHEPFDGWEAVLDRTISHTTIGEFDAIISHEDGHPADYLHIRCAPCPQQSESEAPMTCLLIEKREDRKMAASHMEVTHRLVSLGKLAGKVAHELNNPLDGILRYVNLALRLVEDVQEPKLESYLTESRDGLMRMVQIIADLLEFSRASDGQFEESTVAEVIEQAVRLHTDRADANGIIVVMNLQDRGMPIVRGSRLYQVCGNLIKNAIDAMPDGGRLTIVAGIEGSNVVIRVADTGIGLPPAPDGDNIFDLFFTTKKPGQGTGLGLAICKEFVEEMGGSIIAASADPKGAEFTVCIPVSSFGEMPPFTQRKRKP